MAKTYAPHITRITWADSLMKPEKGFTSILLRSIALAVITYLIAIVPLLFSGDAELILQPLIVASSIGVAWVASMSFMIPWTKRLLDEAYLNFDWEQPEGRDRFFDAYLEYVNNDAMAVLIGIGGWIALMLCIYLLMFTPERFEWILPKLGKPINVEIHQRGPFIFSVGIVTLVGAVLAMTAARYLRGQVIYAKNLRIFQFKSRIAVLRDHLTRHINNTGYAGLAFSSGIAIILFALDLNAKNIIVIESAVCVIAIAGLSYVFVIRHCEVAYRRFSGEAQSLFGSFATASDPPLLRELASLAKLTFSQPLVAKYAVLRTLFSISTPMLIKTFEPQLRNLLSILLN